MFPGILLILAVVHAQFPAPYGSGPFGSAPLVLPFGQRSYETPSSSLETFGVESSAWQPSSTMNYNLASSSWQPSSFSSVQQPSSFSSMQQPTSFLSVPSSFGAESSAWQPSSTVNNNLVSSSWQPSSFSSVQKPLTFSSVQQPLSFSSVQQPQPLTFSTSSWQPSASFSSLSATSYPIRFQQQQQQQYTTPLMQQTFPAYTSPQSFAPSTAILPMGAMGAMGTTGTQTTGTTGTTTSLDLQQHPTNIVPAQGTQPVWSPSATQYDNSYPTQPQVEDIAVLHHTYVTEDNYVQVPGEITDLGEVHVDHTEGGLRQ